MTAATAFCTSNTIFYPHALIPPRPQLTSVLLRSNPSLLSTSVSVSTVDLSSVNENKVTSDENNNSQDQQDRTAQLPTDLDDVLYITSDDDDDIDDDHDFLVDRKDTIITQDDFLSFVGLRPKNKKPNVTVPKLRSLTKRLAFPVCLLPLPKHTERVRQALYVLLPSLKFFKITSNTETFCSTDEGAKAQSLLPRSSAQSRAAKSLKKATTNRKSSKKSAVVNYPTRAVSNNIDENSMDNYAHSILQCHVSLDRLEQSDIDQLMENAIDIHDETIEITPIPEYGDQEMSCVNGYSSSAMTTTTTTTTTTITMETREKTTVKRKSMTNEIADAKRFKSNSDERSMPIDDDYDCLDLSLLMYERIYLKCFVCSKRKYIDVDAIQSNILHSHWLEHGGKLSMNIYDSEIDSILTRVVEFFHAPKRHLLEGKLKTVFMLNSKEVRHSSPNPLSSSDPCIIID